VDAPVMAAKMVVDIKSDVLKSGRELKLTGSTEVRFSCNEMPVDRLLAFLKLAYPEGRISKPAGSQDRQQSSYRHARRGDQADRI